MIIGSIVSAFAFTAGGGIYDTFFRSSDQERHNKAAEELQEETTKWNQKRALTLDFLNDELRKKQQAVSDFQNIDEALEAYNELYPEESKIEIPKKPVLSDFYVPTDETINKDYMIIIGSGIIAGFIVYKYF